MNGIRTRRARARRRRIIAIAAAGAVLLTGATVTSLASWLDEEWITAGVDGDPGVSASEFEIEQQVQGDATWFNRETGPGGVVQFGTAASQLSPGAYVYGWVSLRAAADSVGGTVRLVSDYTVADSALGDVLVYGARVMPTTGTCNNTSYASTGTVLAAPTTPLQTGSGVTTFTLPAGTGGAAGTASTICFRIEFPQAAANDALQGVEATPGWYFESTSN